MAETKATRGEVEDYYNRFKEHQKKLGVNIRHRTIFKNLRAADLKPTDNVLEVGCGIGTVSSLIVQFVTKGRFTGVDISSDSIALANQTIGQPPRVHFVVNDMTSFQSDIKYDFVVLPDVLEHIPVEQHAALFATLSVITTPKAKVLINIPEPNCLNWIRQHYPEKLQIIDQSLSMQDLLNHCYPHGFKLVSMKPYSLQFENGYEYVSILLDKHPQQENYHLKSKAKLGIDNLFSRL